MALIILAGGVSSRMGGRNKALLPLGDTTMIGKLISNLAPLFAHILVSAREVSPYVGLPVQVVVDQYSECGPIGGIHACLQESMDEDNLVLACDLPLFKKELAEFLLSQIGADLVIPYVDGYPEMVAGVYTKRIIPVIDKFIMAGNYKLQRLIDVLNVKHIPEADLRKIDPELISFLNVNTPAEYKKVVEIVNEGE